jgi:dephospho-CoA kinase
MMSKVKVVVTGGIGSGKSTFASALQVCGAERIDADESARRAVEPGTTVHDELQNIVPKFFVRNILDRDGLARRMFSDEVLKAQVEAVIHPWVRADMRARSQQSTANVVVHEIPLLAEHRSRAQLHAEFDYVVNIWATEPVRVQRLLERGMSEIDARTRIAHQGSDADRCAVSDVVVANDGIRGQLEEKAESLMVLFVAGSPVRRTHS